MTPPQRAHPHGAQLIYFTSGSTGRPVGVVLSGPAVVANARLVAARKGMAGGLDVGALTQSLSHVGGLVVGLLAQMSGGVTNVMTAAHFDAREALAAVQDEACTVLDGVSTHFSVLINLVELPSFDIVTLCKGASGAGPMSGETLRSIVQADGLHQTMHVTSYGMTETTCIAFMGSVEDTLPIKMNSVGRVQVSRQTFQR